MATLLTQKEMELWRVKYSTKDNEYLKEVANELKQAYETYNTIATNCRLKAAIAESIIRKRNK